ncbi:helix-turn-helix domain-containing protein [Clostridium caseinilyticum]|uniref:helix-turn-helix domain-containing protein n=1 Tax=Clostridium caseinilyticum TaxID=3350403 RepID=UPI0038F71C57
MVTFGEKLRNARNLKGITLDKMADDLQTTKATLSRYENNLREPKADFIKKIAEYLSINVDYLLGSSPNNVENSTLTKKETETLSEEFLDMLIKHKKIKTKEDLTPQNILKLLNEIFDEIDKQK